MAQRAMLRAAQRTLRAHTRSTQPALVLRPFSSSTQLDFSSTRSRHTGEAGEPLPWFVDPSTAPTSSPVPSTSSTLATAPVPTPPPSHLPPPLHPLHAYLSTSPFLDKHSIKYIHAREADPEGSWCDWVVVASLREGRERGLRGAMDGVKRFLAKNPVELDSSSPDDPLESDPDSPPPPPSPFAPPSTSPIVHGLPTAPSRHARRRAASSTRAARKIDTTDPGTGWAMLDSGTLVVHVMTSTAREEWGRGIEDVWEGVGALEARERGEEGWVSSARREESRLREEELRVNMEEVRREMVMEEEAQAELEKPLQR
ncbi:hypothetical protein RTBOTA2_001284 [Rhodotorula toruloides]|nr:hypothetical protein RTBOTA2_001284 [Rhodotorula toruloides]